MMVQKVQRSITKKPYALLIENPTLLKKKTIFALLSKETCVVSKNKTKNKYLNLDDADQEYRALYPKKKRLVFSLCRLKMRYW